MLSGLTEAGASGSVSVGFKTEKAEASVQTSTVVTGTIEGGHSVTMDAHKGSISSLKVRKTPKQHKTIRKTFL